MVNVLEKYSIARHRYIGTGVNLLVIKSGEVFTKVKYVSNGVFYTETFHTDELEEYVMPELICN
jgi:hypothetical protein